MNLRSAPCALLVALYVAACGTSSPTVTADQITRGFAEENEGLPRLDDPMLQRKLERSQAEMARYRQNPAQYFPVAEAPLDCSVRAEDGELLLFNTSRARQEATHTGLAISYSDYKFSVVRGDCSSGRLNGPGVMIASTTQHYELPNGSARTAMQAALHANFVDGRPEGEFARYVRFDEPRWSGEIAASIPDPKTGWTITMEYGRRTAGELVEPSLLFTFQEEGVQRSTHVYTPVSPGLWRGVGYLGRNKVSDYYMKDGTMHGAFVTAARPKVNLPASTQCYVEGRYDAAASCDGPNVSAGSAPSDSLADAKRAEALARREELSAKSNDAATRRKIDGGLDDPQALDELFGQNDKVDTADAVMPPPRSTTTVAASAKTNPWPDLAAAGTPVGGGAADAAIIVGVEDYAFVTDVPGARQNAKDWYRYFTKIRGTNPGNVKLLLDNQATDVGMKSAMEAAASLVGDGGTLWFVFIGHGAPSADQKDGLLVGVDAQQSAQGLYGRSVPQRALTQLAANGKQARTVFVVDACFSGRSGNGEALAPGLQPLLPVDQVVDDKRTLVFTAADSTQFAGPLPGLGRPAFSYLMLGGLLGWSDRNKDGTIATNELIGYSQDTLRAVLNDRSQTPAMFPVAAEPLAGSAGAAEPDVSEIVLGQ